MIANGFANAEELAIPAEDVTEPKALAERLSGTAQPVALLGVAFDKVTLRDAADRIEEMIASHQPHYVVTANVDFLVQSRRDLELQRILLHAPLVLCDGTPLVWASRLLGNPLPERVAGADLVPELIRLSAKKHYRLFFLGTTEEANTQAIAKLHREFPDLEIDHYAPPFSPLLKMKDREIVRRIRTARPDMLLVAFGCPKAEKWIAMHYRELGVPVCIGVGASIDFLAGRVKRAPVWMQRSGIEWVFRLIQEPRRLFKRYATDLGAFGGAMLWQWLNMKSRARKRDKLARSVVSMSEPAWVRIEPSPCLNRASIEGDAELWNECALADRHCLVETSAIQTVDSTGMAALIHLQKQLRAHERQLVLLSPSAAMRSAIKVMKLEAFFEIASDAVEARELITARVQEQRALDEDENVNPLTWHGEITVMNARRIGRRTWAMIDHSNSHAEPWIIDLADVRFMDSGGVKMLVQTVELARRSGVRLHFNNPTPAVRNVLHFSKLDQLLEAAA